MGCLSLIIPISSIFFNLDGLYLIDVRKMVHRQIVLAFMVSEISSQFSSELCMPTQQNKCTQVCIRIISPTVGGHSRAYRQFIDLVLQSQDY